MTSALIPGTRSDLGKTHIFSRADMKIVLDSENTLHSVTHVPRSGHVLIFVQYTIIIL